jgi:hypothetical protein
MTLALYVKKYAVCVQLYIFQIKITEFKFLLHMRLKLILVFKYKRDGINGFVVFIFSYSFFTIYLNWDFG